MPAAITDGILGLEAVHTWNGGAFALNDIEKTPRLPRVRVDRIRGLHSLPDADDNRAPNTARHGETPYPSLTRGKTVIYEGRLQAATLQDLRALVSEMRAAFFDRSNEHFMAVTPHEDYAGEDGVSWFYAARVLQLDIDDEQGSGYSRMPSPFERAFTLGLRMSDPRYYLDDPEVGGPYDGTTTTRTVENRGTAPADPFLEITPADPPGIVTIENLSVLDPDGEPVQLVFDFSDLWFTPTALRVSFQYRTAVVDYVGVTDQDVTAYMDITDSSWWDEHTPGLAPGENQLRVTGSDSWEIAFFSASW